MIRTTLALAALALASAACDGGESDGGRALDGPLVANVIAGGQALHAPRGDAQQSWWASYGGLGVCTEGPEVTIEGIRFIGEEPLEHEVYVFRGQPGYQGVLGAAPTWREPYATLDRSEDAGRYQKVPGGIVDEVCDELGDGGSPRVVPVMKTDARGFRAEALWIDYSAEGEEYAVKMPWEIVLCGSEQPKDLCA